LNPVRLFALTQVETVGLWVALIVGVVSIVLSVVAILFARDVDRRSIEISNQTVRSLETIETTVQRLSEDTGGLIKVAWERMLGNVGPSVAQSDRDLQTVLAGLLGEFRQDASELAPGTGIENLARDVGKRLDRATSHRSGHNYEGAPRNWAFNAAVQAVESLSPLAIELLRAFERGPRLTRAQYQGLRRDDEISAALDELRDSGILIAFQHDATDTHETVYGVAPWFRDVIGPALVFTGHESPSALEAQRVTKSLRDVGHIIVTGSP
jgi:hypothetical protein